MPCFIFDVDDTLVEYVDFDFEEWYRFLVVPVAEQLGFEMTLDEWRGIVKGHLARDHVERYGVSAVEFWKAVDERNLEYRRWMLSQGRLRAHPDAEAIRHLPGRKAAVSNSSTRCAEFALEAAGLRDAFDAVVGKDYGEYRYIHEAKPRPGLILVVKRLMGCERCIFVGDSPSDVRAGKGAGCLTVQVLRGGEVGGADITVRSLWELVEVFTGK